MKSIESFGYTIISKDNEILEELKEINENNEGNIIAWINWNNFNKGDIYYSDNCEEYYIIYIDHEKKSLELSKYIKDLL